LTITSTGVATPGGLDTDVQFNDGGTLFGNGDFTYNKSTKVVASTVFNAVTGFQIGGAAASGKFLRGNGTNFVSSGIQTGDVTWDQIGNAAGSLTLANGTNATTFNQTSAVSWTWANATAATGGANQLSPVLTIAGTYWTGAVSAVDSWTIQNVLGSGSNPTTSLTFAHSGSGTAVSITVPNQITISNVGSVSAVLVLEGSSSGAAGWTVGGAAGSPHLLQMPSLDPVATGAVLQATVGNPTATSWTTTPTLSTLTITGATPTGSGTQLSFGNTTATSANAGSNGDVPAQVVGYIVLDLGGVKIKVPYYAT
jgi:hypothetical protein